MKSPHCLRTCSSYEWRSNSSTFRGWTISVCSFSTSKLLFRRNKKIWRKGILFKASSVASHQTMWYIRRMLTKGYSVPRDFSWVENYKPIWLGLVTWCCYFTTRGILEKTWNCGSVSPNNLFSQCNFQWIKRNGN